MKQSIRFRFYARRLAECLSSNRDIVETVSIVATAVIALVSLAYSCQANRQSAVQSRPVVTIDVIKTDGRYLTAEQTGDIYRLSAQLRLKNYGATPAVKLSLPRSMMTGPNILAGRPNLMPVVGAPSPSDLGVGSEFNWTVQCEYPIAGNDSDMVNKVNSGQMGMAAQFEVVYSDLHSKKSAYRTTLLCDVFAGARVIKTSSIE